MRKTPDIPDTTGEATREWCSAVRLTLQILTGRRAGPGDIAGALACGVSLVQDVQDTLRAGNGGTGQNTYAVGDVLYSGSKNLLSKLAIGAVGTVLISDGAVPSWGLVPTTSLSGILQAAQFPALLGDVTTTAGSLTTAIGANKVTLPMMAQIADARVLGNSSGVTANVSALATLPLGVQDNITRLGTVVSGSWHGATIGATFGGTGLTAGTSGGVLAFTASGTLASSAALSLSALVLGGGAGAVPSTPVGLGASTQVLHGNAAGAPSWAAVSPADVSASTGSGSFVLATAPTLSSLAVSGRATVGAPNGNAPGLHVQNANSGGFATIPLVLGNTDYSPNVAGMSIRAGFGAATGTTYGTISVIRADAFPGALALQPAGGNLIIGTTTDAGQTLQVAGSLMASGAVTFPGVSTTAAVANAVLDNAASNNLLRSTSSLRYKHVRAWLNDRPQDVHATLARLAEAAFTYTSRALADDPAVEFYGLGAELVDPIEPRLVTRGRFGAAEAVQYERLPVLNTVAIADHERRMRAAGL